MSALHTAALAALAETHMACLNHKGLIVACDCGVECDWRGWCAHVAAEITAYLLSDETVERAAESIYLAVIETHEDPWPTWEFADDGWRKFVMTNAEDALRAALTAALTEGVGE